MKKQFLSFLLLIVGLAFFYLSRYNYLIFHITIEIIISSIGILIFGVSLASLSFKRKSLFTLLGPGFLASSLIGILHTITYYGMDIIPGFDANLSAQLWIILSFLLSVTFLFAILCFEKKVNYYAVLFVYILFAAFSAALCFLRIFPDCYIAGQGLTVFKRASEYLIILIYTVSLISLKRLKGFEKGFVNRLTSFLCLLIVSGFFFTLYTDLFGIFNFLGHYIKLTAFLIIYDSLLKDLILIPYKKILFDSTHDSLTGFYNHEFLFRFIEENKYANPAVIHLDIDSLKLINDTLGYSAGDKLILKTSEIINSSLSGDYLTSHIGGGEFAIIINTLDNSSLFSAIQQLDSNLYAYNIDNPNLPLSLTYGYSSMDNKETNIMEVYRNASRNMHTKKILNNKSNQSALVNTLMKTLETKDFTTEEHAVRMVELATALAKRNGLSENRLNEIVLFTQFHDIGKIGIPDGILLKPGPLTNDERLAMEQHSRLGYEIAISSSSLACISDFILKHHERWDGKGYPFGLSKEQIPIECRILSIVDTYDAIINDRPYRKALSREEALAEIKRCSGTQFDPVLVQMFLEII